MKRAEAKNPKPAPAAPPKPPAAPRFTLNLNSNRMVGLAMALGAAALIGWVRMQPLSLGGLDDRTAVRLRAQIASEVDSQLDSSILATQRGAEIDRIVNTWMTRHGADFETWRKEQAELSKSDFIYKGDDGREHVFLGDSDSYHWLRMARNYLRTGTTCDTNVNGVCRDTFTNAPAGRRNIYARSIHVAAIVAVDRLMNLFRPGFPLAASAFLVPVLIGILGVFPAFAIGRRLAGNLGGLAAAITIGLSPMLLTRSIGADNDVWNVVLPLCVAWGVIEALAAPSLRKSIAYAALAVAFVALQAGTWSGPLAAWRSGAQTNALLTSSPEQPPTLESLWPDNYSIAAESEHRNLQQIADSLGGRWMVFAAALGLLTLVLPRARWRRSDFALLAAGGLLYAFLLAGSEGDINPWPLAALLAAPVVAALLGDLFWNGGQSASDRGAALIMIAWFCVALMLAFRGDRFVMLLGPPFGIAFAALLGRAYGGIDRALRARQIPLAGLASAAAFVLLAAVLIVPARNGYAIARGYVPEMNEAWWTTLSDLREHSAADAIVNTWWDYGYWIKYVAERRVSNDGGSLATHIPFWLGRAMLAHDDNEAAGLLRMLDCGSEATPEPEGSDGAYGRLVAAGVDSLSARALLPELAILNFNDAKARLAQSGLGESAQLNVLAATHCDPPPAYLVLSTAMADSGWQRIANWDFRRAYAWEHDRSRPEADAVSDLTGRLGLSPADARALYQQLGNLHSDDDVKYFLSPSDPYVGNGWIPCGNPGDAELECRANIPIGNGALLTGILYSPQGTKLRIAAVSAIDGKPHALEGAPGLVELAADKQLVRQPAARPAFPDIALLADPARGRVLLGPSFLIDSTFTRLLFLDGVYSKLFSRAYQTQAFTGEVITVWKINWPDVKTNSPGRGSSAAKAARQ